MKRETSLSVAIALYCVYIVIAQEDGNVKIVNGPSGVSICGRVEIFHNGEWGTVCDDRWNLANGNVVCKQLGYLRAKKIYYTAHFGRGNGPIWMDGVQCSEGQNSLAECRHNGWGLHDCSHAEDAGVCCEREEAEKPKSIPVRLSCPQCNVGGSCKACPDKIHPDPTDCLPRSVVKGIVEVQVNGVWGTISGEGWGWTEATIVCGQLGYPMAYYSTYTRSLDVLWPNYTSESDEECIGDALNATQSLRDNLSHTLLQGVDCSGRESTLHECYIAGVGSKPNPSQVVATVQCGFFPHTECYGMSFSEVYTVHDLFSYICYVTDTFI